MDERAETETDEAAMERLRSGDQRALAVLYDRYSPLMLGVGCQMLRSREEAEDVLHDVFMEAWRKADTWDPARGSVRAWLVLRMRSRVLDRIRAPARKRATSTEDLGEGVSPPALVAEAPEAPRLRTEQRRFQEALAGLPEEQREIVRLVYFEGQALGQVGERLGVPTGTVKSRLFNARARLREALGPEVRP
jgi:RNA polymerase sigma-70 factor (ECF subfamily)